MKQEYELIADTYLSDLPPYEESVETIGYTKTNKVFKELEDGY